MKTAACLALLAALAAAACVPAAATPLDDYVWREDSTYAWQDTGLRVDAKKEGWHGYVLNMTSQTWLTEEHFAPGSAARSVWWHLMLVIVPNGVVAHPDKVLMYITNGGNTGNGTMGATDMTADPQKFFPSDEDVVLVSAVATKARTVAAVLFQIPNEPCTFAGDTSPYAHDRSEDAIIAWTWNRPSQHLKERVQRQSTAPNAPTQPHSNAIPALPLSPDTLPRV